jgi:hypothetical protein
MKLALAMIWLNNIQSLTHHIFNLLFLSVYLMKVFPETHFKLTTLDANNAMAMVFNATFYC